MYKKSKHLTAYKELLTLLSSTGISSREIQDELGIGRAVVSQLIQRLKEKGVMFTKEYESRTVLYSVVNMQKINDLYQESRFNV